MKKVVLLFSLLFILIGCEKDDLAVPAELEINDFVWKGMNQYYLWQSDVPNLSDDRFANQSALNDFLSEYSNPTLLFNSLRVDASIDRFSVIYSDYNVLEGVLSGNTLNNGLDFGLRYKQGSTTDIFGWVRYVLPNSSAAAQNLQRGLIFYGINGTQLTESNYQSLLSATTYTLNLADYDNGNITPNGQSVTLTRTQLAENPVYSTEVFVQGNKKIGYLMYNGFFSSYENQLNAAFGALKSQNITHLVLDLRYNSGGSVATATRLASLIAGQFNGQVFAKQQWNAKLENYYMQNNPSSLFNYFTNTTSSGSILNHLNLNKVYILTSRSTASASELVINGLKPYIDVIQIGETTTGKNVGSVTLYDSPNFSKATANPNHKYAMQPLVLKTVNSVGFGDYQSGLPATIQQSEDFGNLGVIGDASEPLLATAINQIITSGRMIQQPQTTFTHCSDSKALEPLRNEMYVELK
jgi:carboxyl-terminal processing protease